MSSNANPRDAWSHARHACALFGLTLLTLVNFQLFIGYPPALSILPLATGAITLVLALAAPWPLTLGICAAWPLLIDVRHTARLLLNALGSWEAAEHWLASLPPYPTLTTVLSIAGLTWAWRSLKQSPPLGSLFPDAIGALTWLLGVVLLVGTVIGLANLNPLFSEGLWETLVTRSWRWSMAADLDTFHPLAVGHAGIMGLLFFTMIRSQAIAPHRQRALVLALIFSGVGVAIVGVAQFLQMEDTLAGASTWLRDRRIVSLLRDPNSLGSSLTAALLLVLPMGIAAFAPQRSDGERSMSSFRMFAAVGGAAVLVAALLMTGSRMAWAASGLTIAAWAVAGGLHQCNPANPAKGRATRIAPILGLIWLIALVWPVLPPTADQGVHPLQRRLLDVFSISENPSDTELREGLAGRHHHWRVARSMIHEHPWWGQGVGTFRLLYDAHREVGNPMERENAHSQILQVWAESGIVGLSVLTLIIVFALGTGCGPAPAKLALVGFLLTGLTGHPLLLPEMQLVLWILVALAAPRRTDADPAVSASSSGAKRWIITVLAPVVVLSGACSATLAVIRSRENPQRWGLYEVFMSDPGGVPFIWTGGHAGFSVEVDEPLLALPLRAGHPDVGAEPIEVSLVAEGEPLLHLTFHDTLWRMVVLDLRPWQGQTVDLEVDVSRTWSPSTWGIPDHRELGLALGPWEAFGVELMPDPETRVAWPLPSLHGERGAH